MAVTQISRIQVRRGKKLSPTGIPQLASGEIAWTVDSQELFIGNGSVAEGAPYVGNTKILTEHDNILALISSYRFAAEDPSIPFSVSRPLQSKLDEYVSVADFGAIGDGITDNVAAFNAAFVQLFQNSNINYRRVLKIPNGVYLFTSDLKIPSNIVIEGDTREYTVLKPTGIIKLSSPLTDDVDEFTINNRPENISISNLTIEGSQVRLSGGSNVSIENVKFIGNYELADPSEDPLTQTPTVYWINSDPVVSTTDLSFKDCLFINHELAIKCVQTEEIETAVIFDNCKFAELDSGIVIVGIENQINNWKILNSQFINIANYGIYSSNGSNTLVRDCYFEKCGSNLDGTPSSPSIYFGSFKNNLVIDCFTDRQQEYGITSVDNTTYISEVYGADKVSFTGRNYSPITVTDSFLPISIFSAYSRYIFVEYTLRLTSLTVETDTRSGKLTITVDRENNIVNLTDNYTFNSRPGTATGYVESNLMNIFDVSFGRLYKGAVISGTNITPGTRIVGIDPTVNVITQAGEYIVDRTPSVSPTSAPPNYQTIQFERNTMTLFEFSVSLIEGETIGTDTVMLRYRNPINSGFAGDFSFNVTYGV